ncbi:hypothetical protein P691DRAFT_800758 [Macrolepiota fuliginosa MF-IS2]|uniref:Nucleoporin Nup54 alpha-helical domain-containing protein n=1 Tax=Macrolepiota fuliginosa MF-IS2 TaxID=1400762 RepID=A0A9P5XPS5_9AGAR|nr:hypothetical protein P691DRAFT_800758 [Macrolepiota fuliginosa MF-IS2]
MSLFGNANNPNPLFGGKPAASIFGTPTAQTNPQGNAQPNALTLATTQNQPSNTNIFGQTTQQQPATGGSIFGGNSQTNQPATNVFGNTTAQSQPTTGGGIFGSTTTSQQPATGGGIFGNAAQPTTGGGIFGSTGTQQQPAAGGSIFGSTNQQPTQQTGTTSLFGNTTQPTGGTSLFGNTGTSGQTGGTSLFGNTGNAQGQQQIGTASLFGGGTGAGTGTSNLFGNAGQQQQQPSLFGSTAQPTQTNSGFGASSLFGNSTTSLGQSTFGQSIQPNQQTQTAGQIALTKSTKFNDLPDNLKQVLESIDSHIQGRVQISKDLHQRKLGEEPTKGQEMIKQMQKDLLNVSNVIRDDHRHTEDLKARVDQAMQDTIVATRIIDAFRNPQSGTTYLKDHAGFPLEFFQRVTQQMAERLAWYKSTIEQIERRLSSSAGQVQTPQSIAATLQAQNATFLSLASKTAALEAELQKVKALYTQLWRAKTGSVRDPFNDTDRLAENPGDLGFGGLVVK